MNLMNKNEKYLRLRKPETVLENIEFKYGKETIFQCPTGQHSASEKCVSLRWNEIHGHIY